MYGKDISRTFKPRCLVFRSVVFRAAFLLVLLATSATAAEVFINTDRTDVHYSGATHPDGTTFIIGSGATVTDNTEAAIDASGRSDWTIVNNGTLNSTDDEGILGENSDNLTINNTGTITADEEGILIDSSDNAQVVNSGTLQAGDDEEGFQFNIVTNSTFTNEADGEVYGGDDGNGLFVDYSDNIMIINRGLIEAGYYEDGVDIEESSNVTIDNSGTILGNDGDEGDGIDANNEAGSLTDLTIINRSTGVIMGGDDGRGIYVDDGETVTIINHGLIQGGDDADGIEIEDSVDVTITNTGTIQGVNGGNGIYIDDTENIIITNSGTVEGEDNDSIEIEDSTGTTVVNNSGTLTSNEHGFRLTGASDVTLNNTGLIETTDNASYNAIEVDAASSNVTINLYSGSIINGDMNAGATGIAAINVLGALAYSDTITNMDVTIANGALMGGTFDLIGDLANNGVFAPGNSIGTVDITGDYTQSANGIFRVELDDTGSSDLLNVSGTATLDGEINVQPLAGNYTDGTVYTVLDSATGLSGTFSSLTDTSALLSFDIAYTGSHDVELTLHKATLAQALAGTGENTGALAALFDGLDGLATGEVEEVLGVLASLDEAELVGALEQMMPTNNQPMSELNKDVALLFTSALRDHLFALRRMVRDERVDHRQTAEAMEDLLASNSYGPADTAENVVTDPLITGYSPYIGYIGKYGHMDSDSWTSSTHFTTHGIDGGVDFILSDSLVLGMNAGVAFSELAHDGVHEARSLSTSFRMGVYATYFTEDWFVDGSLGYGLNNNYLRRNLTIGAIQSTAKANYLSHALLGHVGGGYSFLFDDLTVTPTATLDYVGVYHPAYEENGAGVLDLEVEARNTQSLQSGLGVRLAYDIVLAESETRITPELRAEWRHEFLNTDQDVTATLAADPGNDFTVTGPDIDRNSARIGAGLTVSLTEQVDFTTLYRVDLSEDTISHNVNAGFLIRF